MTTSRRTALVSVVAAMAVSTAAGCAKKDANGSGSSDPKTRVAASVTNLLDNRSITMTLHLTDPQGGLAKAVRKDSPSAAGSVGRLLAGAIRVTEATHSGGTLRSVMGKSDPKTTDLLVEVIDGSKTLAALALNGGDLYFKVDVQDVKSIAGSDAGSLLTGLSSFSPALAAGQWVEVAGAADLLTGLAKSKAGGHTPSADPSVLTSQLKSVLMSATTVTSTSGGTYNLDLDVKQAAQGLFSAFGSFSANLGLPAGALQKAQSQLGNVPSGAIKLTVTTSGGTATQAALDLQSVVTLAKAAKPAEAAKAPDLTGAQLVVDFQHGKDGLPAPSGATPLDLSKLFGGLLGATGSTSTTPLMSH